MVPSHRQAGFAGVAALFPVQGPVSTKRYLLVTLGVARDKVAAGINPAAIAMLVLGHG
jgi:hypothetical protein